MTGREPALQHPAPFFRNDVASGALLIAHWSEILMYTLLLVQPLVGWGMLSAARYPIVLWGGLHLFPILPHSVTLYAVLREGHTCSVSHLDRADRLFSRMAPWRVRERQAKVCQSRC